MNELYKLVKTNEDYEEVDNGEEMMMLMDGDDREEDMESLYRANELFNSMLKKDNQ